VDISMICMIEVVWI